MKFYVIYSFDIKKEYSVEAFKPPFIKKWQLTELDDQGDYENYPKHRKYTAELTKNQFKKFIDKCDLYMNDIETMGSLTIEYGHIPAFYFDNETSFEYGAINQSAYVTPFPEHAIKGKQLNKSQNDKNWNLIKKALLNLHGYNQTYYSQSYKNYYNIK